MDDACAKSQGKLAEIFGRINLSELPAIGSHVSEVVALTTKKEVRAPELARVILKDYSLTNKVLQVVNSAYYSRGVPITTIERAVAALGIEVIRELAVTISLVDEFLKSGVEKDGLAQELALSYMSAHLAKEISHRKKLLVLPEEAYICALLHELGRIVVVIYLPDLYRRIDMARKSGGNEEKLSRLILKGLSLYELGMEIGRFWNFSETIINAMDNEPPLFENQLDNQLTLQHLAVFTNRFTREVSESADPSETMKYYGPAFKVSSNELLTILHKLLEEEASVSEIIRFGLTRLRMKSRVLQALKNCRPTAAA